MDHGSNQFDSYNLDIIITSIFLFIVDIQQYFENQGIIVEMNTFTNLTLSRPQKQNQLNFQTNTILKKVIELTPYLQKLYKTTLQRTRTIFKTRLFKQKNEMISQKQQDQESNSNQLVKQVDQKTKYYLSWCFMFFNWEYVTVENLTTFIGSLPNTENDIEQVRIEGSYIKFVKNDKAFIVDLLSQKKYLGQNKYFLNSYDPTGKNQFLQYDRSLTKINIGPVPYRFNGLINSVESCQNFVAVATLTSIYIIYIKDNNGMKSQFNIDECIDMKWGQRGLYYLQKNGEFGLIQRQVTFKQRVNKFSSQKTIQLPTLITKQYVAQRIVISGTNQSHNFVYIMSVSRHNEKKILLQAVDSSKQGFFNDKNISIDLKQISGDILYKNLVNIHGEVNLVVVNGNEGLAEQLYVYSINSE